jgi:hypothetical protein
MFFFHAALQRVAVIRSGFFHATGLRIAVVFFGSRGVVKGRGDSQRFFSRDGATDRSGFF